MVSEFVALIREMAKRLGVRGEIAFRLWRYEGYDAVFPGNIMGLASHPIAGALPVLVYPLPGTRAHAGLVRVFGLISPDQRAFAEHDKSFHNQMISAAIRRYHGSTPVAHLRALQQSDSLPLTLQSALARRISALRKIVTETRQRLRQ